MTLEVLFGDPIPGATRRRLTYAAQSFAAMYGFAWKPGDARLRLCYGIAPSREGDIALTVAYRPLAERDAAVHPYERKDLFLDGESDAFPRLHRSVEGADWLAEIFEWLGNETEYRTPATDDIGRVPFRETIPGRYGLDAEVPWAAIAMRGLNEDIRAAVSDWPAQPIADGRPFLVSTHDLDFLPVSRTQSLERGMKNALIALLAYRSPRLALSILGNLHSFDGFAEVARRELALGIESSAYPIVEKRHRRDANYVIDDPRVLAMLRELESIGMEIGVHGSYTSLLGDGSLPGEYARLRRAGFAPAGGRQHWLRFRSLELYDALLAAGAEYDCSVGYSDRPGFRSGASFAYAPYDFREERPLPILQLPTTIMDGTLFARHGYDFAAARETSERVLRRATLYAGGGTSIIWHNTAFGGVQLPRELGELYWQLKRDDVDWIAGRTAARRLAPRFQAAGLLQRT